ncbi:F-box/kelch-repeat protein At4g39590 [Brassica napus]|uniref:F-box/kelch-repeat protein At4g39590 n=1 Tax=Brassica napus TaxID=3708 RepID=UPI0020791034|nr:F-box/kelch-repeat protein At4g39590 [Brassica napus]
MSSTAESSAAVNGDKPPHKKMTTQSPEISILSLPYDLLLNCLARVSRLYYPTLSLVSKKFRSVVASPDLYEARSLLHRTESCLYLCLRYDRDYPRNLDTYWFVLCRKPNRTVTDRSSGHLFIPVPSPQLRPARSMSLVAVGSNIYRIGGDMPSSSRVSVLDCRFNTWHRAPRMRLKRSSPAASLIDGKIYVAGGCEDPSSVNWIEVFDPKTRTWGNVANPGTETRPGASVRSFGIGGKLYIRGNENVVYDPKEASWNPIGLGIDMAFAASFNHCVIGDVMFLWDDDREFRWYDSKASSWKKLNGVEDLPNFYGYCKMVDHGGKKMALLWEGYLRSEFVVWCAEIALEMRDGDEMWGIVEWLDVVLSLNEPFRLFDANVLSATV